MTDKPIENVDIVAAILTASIVGKVNKTYTARNPLKISDLIKESVVIFKDVRQELEK